MYIPEHKFILANILIFNIQVMIILKLHFVPNTQRIY